MGAYHVQAALHSTFVLMLHFITGLLCQALAYELSDLLASYCCLRGQIGLSCERLQAADTPVDKRKKKRKIHFSVSNNKTFLPDSAGGFNSFLFNQSGQKCVSTTAVPSRAFHVSGVLQPLVQIPDVGG